MLKEGAYAEAEENAEEGIEYEGGFSKETLKRLIESHKVPTDFGKSGILFRIGNEELSPEDREKMAAFEGDDNPEGTLSIKALKIFDAVRAKHEFASLQEARNIIIKNAQDSRSFARIPRAIGYDEIEVDRETQNRLNANGASLTNGKVGVLTMDWIEGKDLAAVLYEELIRRSPENEGINEGTIWDSANFDRLLHALEKTNFVLPEAILIQLKHTVELMHNNKFYHNDLHLRNLILKDGDLENPQLYMIDFADASHEKQNIEEAEGEYFLSDENIIKSLEPLTKSPEAKTREYNEKITAEWNERVAMVEKQPRAVEQYESLKKSLDINNANMLEGQFAISSGSASDLENFMGNLLRLSRENELYRDQIKTFLSDFLNDRKGKTKNYYALNRIQSLLKAIEN